MKWCSVLGLLVAVSGVADEAVKEPNLEGMNPSDIEKMMMEEFGKPKGSGKDNFNFTKTVQPILQNFKIQLIKDKKKMQRQLNSDIADIHKCTEKMRKRAGLVLLEALRPKKQGRGLKVIEKCPTEKNVKKCFDRWKRLWPKQKACKELKKIADKEADSIKKLIGQWNKQKIMKKDCKVDRGETKYHYVDRLHNHFSQKLKRFEKSIKDWHDKRGYGGRLKKGCDILDHYSRRLAFRVCAKKKADNFACTCGKVLKEKKLCKQFDGCYSASVRAYKNNKKEIEKKNAAAKLEWRAVGRIECLLKVLGVKKGQKPDQKKLTKCIKGPQISTKPLDLKYGKVPKKPKCFIKGVKDKQRQNCNKK